MGIQHFTRKSSTAVLTGTGIITAIAGLTTLAMVMIGLPPAAAPARQAPADPKFSVADWKQSPATMTLTDVLNNPPAGWAKQGELQQLVTAPLPYSCPQPGLAPSVSLARTFTSGSSRLQVITLAYTAGIGAEAMSRQASNAYVCAGSETGLTLGGVNGPGTDAKLATTSRGGVRASVLSFRRGDVITYVTGSPADPLQTLAKAFDDGLTRRLSPVCVDQESTTADATRSPWSSAGYSQYSQEATVAIAEVPLPSTEPTNALSTPATSPAPDPTPSPAATLERVPLPAPDLVDRTVTPMNRPSFPVAPDMPAPVAEPTPPTAPAAKAILSATEQVPTNDAQGPGCGWAFTGMKPLEFDEADATKTRTALLAGTKAKLEADAKTWQDSVLTYWTGYAAYKKQAAAYNAYADQVAQVNKAWTVIGNSWASYNAAVQDRDRKAAVRADFITRQDAARKAYDTKTAQCAVIPTPSPSPSPSPAPSPSPSASPSSSPSAEPSATASASPSPTPTPSASPQPGCPADRPAILDQSAPEVPAEPVRPADPAKG
ncbi:hypothetical protein IV500_04710 [Paeniglutamicibacter antarcticus]|uniref:Uncharacterized protein n=1 Tax=Arthrobacter terrae TaxID=2935737 RepID=A0A931G6X8_9MICC|nr:hypothetical protein [Arthrobacter terrae]MBG0738719.1 hypothetical protein [Arthrobacter terrae]